MTPEMRRQNARVVLTLIGLVVLAVVVASVAMWWEERHPSVSSVATSESVKPPALTKKTSLVCPVRWVRGRYDAEASPASGDAAATIRVSFRQTKPSAADAAAVLRHCADVAMRAYSFSNEVLLTAVYELD